METKLLYVPPEYGLAQTGLSGIITLLYQPGPGSVAAETNLLSARTNRFAVQTIRLHGGTGQVEIIVT